MTSGADPGFPVGEGADPWGGGASRQHIILSKFPKKLHEIEKIVGRMGAPPFDPPLDLNNFKICMFFCEQENSSIKP